MRGTRTGEWLLQWLQSRREYIAGRYMKDKYFIDTLA